MNDDINIPMTLRDYFAAHAAATIVARCTVNRVTVWSWLWCRLTGRSRPHFTTPDADQVADAAYAVADSMLARRLA